MARAMGNSWYFRLILTETSHSPETPSARRAAGKASPVSGWLSHVHILFNIRKPTHVLNSMLYETPKPPLISSQLLGVFR